MSIIVDLVIILIILLSIFLGYRQGLIKAAIKIASFFIAIAVAFILYQPVANAIMNNTTIDEKIQTGITDRILPEGVSPDSKVQITGIPNSIISSAENTVTSISHELAVKIIGVASLLIIYIIVRLVLRFITILADLIAKIPILKQFNELRRSVIWAD
ncbi:MAG: CvpA family protein [Firmicutes bacterium]|nr:CvpA family protein [Bacillota bacterium]